MSDAFPPPSLASCGLFDVLNVLLMSSASLQMPKEATKSTRVSLSAPTALSCPARLFCVSYAAVGVQHAPRGRPRPCAESSTSMGTPLPPGFPDKRGRELNFDHLHPFSLRSCRASLSAARTAAGPRASAVPSSAAALGVMPLGCARVDALVHVPCSSLTFAASCVLRSVYC